MSLMGCTSNTAVNVKNLLFYILMFSCKLFGITAAATAVVVVIVVVVADASWPEGAPACAEPTR